MTNGHSHNISRKTRSNSNSSTDSDSENEQKPASTHRNRSHYHDEKNGSTIVTNTTLNVTRLFGKYYFQIYFYFILNLKRSLYGNDRNA